MKQFSKELGKVSITPKGDWDSSITNENLILFTIDETIKLI